jgi:hypothetical protein
MLPVSNFGVKCMSMGLLVKPEESIVWRGPMVMGAVEKMVHGTLWYSSKYKPKTDCSRSVCSRICNLCEKRLVSRINPSLSLKINL